MSGKVLCLVLLQAFGLAQKLGPVQNILGPVKGQGISFWLFNWLYGQNIQIFLNIVILTFWKILEIPTIVIERNLQIGVK